MKESYEWKTKIVFAEPKPCPVWFILAVGSVTYEPGREKNGFCICENKDAGQLRGNHEADQRLCFRYMDSTIPLLPKSEISSLQL